MVTSGLQVSRESIPSIQPPIFPPSDVDDGAHFEFRACSICLLARRRAFGALSSFRGRHQRHGSLDLACAANTGPGDVYQITECCSSLCAVNAHQTDPWIQRIQ